MRQTVDNRAVVCLHPSRQGTSLLEQVGGLHRRRSLLTWSVHAMQGCWTGWPCWCTAYVHLLPQSCVSKVTDCSGGLVVWPWVEQRSVEPAVQPHLQQQAHPRVFCSRQETPPCPSSGTHLHHVPGFVPRACSKLHAQSGRLTHNASQCLAVKTQD